MKTFEIIRLDIEPKEKLKILTSQKPTTAVDIQKYIDYYDGKQEILERIHPTNLKKSSELVRLVINLYKKITNTAAFFLFGEEPELVLNDESEENIKLFEEFKTSYRQSKTGEINSKIGIETVGFTESAEILYVKDGKVKYKFVSARNEKLYPFYDENGDFSGFTRVYKVDVIKEKKVVEVEHYEVYTETEMVLFEKDKSNITQVGVKDEKSGEIKTQKYEKIPVIYYNIKEPLAWQVKSLLDRLNLMSSTLGDVNNSFAFPIMMLLGLLVKDPKTGETSLSKNAASILHMSNKTAGGENAQADAKYLTWDSKPESAIYELGQLFTLSLYLTNTPNLDFNNLKGLGGIAESTLKMMFVDATAQAGYLKNIFFSLQRRINLHKDLLTKVTSGKDYNKLDISMKFNSPIPENIKELIENLNSSKISGTMSVETAVINNPYSKDNKKEIERIKEEETEAGTLTIE